MTPEETKRQESLGGVYAFAAYFLWGFMPLYFILLAPIGPWEIVVWRILFSLVFCAILLTVTRTWPKLIAILRDRRLVFWTIVAGLLIYVNWQVFLLGILTGHVIEGSLGYFINPIVTVLLGVLVLGEKLRTAQWVAIAFAALAVVVIIVAYGSFPWIALTLAASFGTYGLVKKQIGPSVDAISGLTLESLWLTPIAIVQVVVVAMTTGLTIGTAGAGHTVLLTLAGAVTAIPLLFYANGAKLMRLSTMGFLQYIAPTMIFLTAVFVFGEEFGRVRAIAFPMIWAALAVYTIALLRGRRPA